jgi:hypothetical protein
MRNLIAACYRVHGENFLVRVARRFERTGTTLNLLGLIRCEVPADERTAEPAPRLALLPPVSDPDLDDLDLLPGLTYGSVSRPPFDPTSSRRYDRRRSNPDAARFFKDEELGGPTHQSPTSKAISR